MKTSRNAQSSRACLLKIESERVYIYSGINLRLSRLTPLCHPPYKIAQRYIQQSHKNPGQDTSLLTLSSSIIVLAHIESTVTECMRLTFIIVIITLPWFPSSRRSVMIGSNLYCSYFTTSSSSLAIVSLYEN